MVAGKQLNLGHPELVARASESRRATGDRQVRACTPAPGAWTTLAGERLKLGPVSLLADDTSLAAGELGVDLNRVRVGTASHAVVLGEVRALGK